jgi:hypothetical protein
MGWVVPVGVAGGVNSGFGGIPDGSGIIRLADQVLIVEPDLYRLWQRAASAPELEQLLEWAAAEGIADAQDLVQDLLARGLLIAQSATLAPRVGPLAISMIGDLLGNGDDPQAPFVAAGRDGALIGVSLHLFELLLRCDGATAVEALCNGLDEASGASANHTLAGICEGLPVLVSNGIVRLNAGPS